MKLGIVFDGQRNFLEELLEDWQANFETESFAYKELKLTVAKGRINPLLYRSSLKKFIDRQDIVFYEWAGGNLVAASKLHTRTPILARLHSWELFHHAKWVNWARVEHVNLVSEAMRRRFGEFFPDYANKAVVIPAGKSLNRFAPVPHPFSGKIYHCLYGATALKTYNMLDRVYVGRQGPPMGENNNSSIGGSI